MKTKNKESAFDLAIDNIKEGYDLSEEICLEPGDDDLLKLAAALYQIELTDAEEARTRITAQLAFTRPSPAQTDNKDVLSYMKIQWSKRPLVILGMAAVFSTLCCFAVFPGHMTAMAAKAADGITKILHLSDYSTVIQLSGNQAEWQQDLNGEQGIVSITKKGTEGNIEGEVTVSTKGKSDGSVTVEGIQGADGSETIRIAGDEEGNNGIKTYSDLNEVEDRVDFKILTPGWLPEGYSLKKAEIYEDSKEYVNLYYSGQGEDIIIMQRLMNKNTAFALATDSSVDEIKINGCKGAWVAPRSVMWDQDGIHYHISVAGLSKEDTIKIAESMK